MSWPTGHTALVTGAASGIGFGIAKALVAVGARVALVDIDAARLQEAETSLRAAGGTVLAVPFDIAETDRWEELADRVEEALGPVSVLCNVAGVNGGGTADRTPLEVWRWVHGVNLDAQFAAVAAFLPRFQSRGGRTHILNTSSVAGLVPMAGVAAYASSKFASAGFSMVLRDELRGTDVGVSLLVPGSVATAINFHAGEAEAKLLGRQMDREAAERNSALLSRGADPDRVGEQAVEAVREGQFLVVTHREWGPFVTRVHREIENAYEGFDGRHGPDPVATAMAESERVV
ncbi:SDR family oxidoreductase [Streptomyces sp. NPDC006422]|uniref:SDR family NAD(P)-dependent oxidoreductase n=1 Tax=unclassified Streptomyces TaxID=2593676 RepID=UPI0033B04DD2